MQTGQREYEDPEASVQTAEALYQRGLEAGRAERSETCRAFENRAFEAEGLAIDRAVALETLLRRIRRWDHMDTAADGAYWRAEIDRALPLTEPERGDERAADTHHCLGCGHVLTLGETATVRYTPKPLHFCVTCLARLNAAFPLSVADGPAPFDPAFPGGYNHLCGGPSTCVACREYPGPAPAKEKDWTKCQRKECEAYGEPVPHGDYPAPSSPTAEERVEKLNLPPSPASVAALLACRESLRMSNDALTGGIGFADRMAVNDRMGLLRQMRSAQDSAIKALAAADAVVKL